MKGFYINALSSFWRRKDELECRIWQRTWNASVR
jgi:hypothetical protein